MNVWKNRIIVAAVAGVVALVGGIAWAGSTSGERHAARAKQFITWRVDDALDELDATDAQRTKVHAIKDQLFEEGVRLHATKEQVRAGLIAQWKTDRPDGTAVHALVDRMFDDLRAFAHKVADAGIALHQTLNPEQRQALLERAEARHGRWHH